MSSMSRDDGALTESDSGGEQQQVPIRYIPSAPVPQKGRSKQAAESTDEDEFLPASEKRVRKSPVKSAGRERPQKRASKSAKYDSDGETEEENSDYGKAPKVVKYVPKKAVSTVEVYYEPEVGVEKILAVRMTEMNPPRSEFFIKWKLKSYLHCTWVDQSVVEADGTTGKNKVKNFLKKFGHHATDGKAEHMSQEYTVVERVVYAKEVLHNGERRKMYLVKWKWLPYKDCSYEFEDDIQEFAGEIEKYHRRQILPTTHERIPVPRPMNNIGFTQLEESPIYKGDHVLREYQLHGLNWLIYCWREHRNSILADEMGLGKTAQTVTMMNFLFTEQRIRGPFLIIAPLSTIPHWQREFDAWTDMNGVVYHGDELSRREIRDLEWRYTVDGVEVQHIYKFHVLITTYEMILQDSYELSKIPWQYIAVDEAHRLKNRESKLMQAIRLYRSEHWLLLTGTPLQNNMEELWSLLNLIDPRQFPSRPAFMADFGNMRDSEQVSQLHKILRPYMLRRMKEDVEKTLLAKEETIINVELTVLQKTYYRAIYERNMDVLQRGGKTKNTPSLLNIVMELRKCCNHPFLIKGVEEAVLAGSGPATPEAINLLIQCSGKLVLIDKLLPKLRSGNHKVLIFSQMVKMLDILEDFLIARQFSFERLDGRLRGNDRQAAIDRYCNKDGDKFVFLASTRAGGQGINLTAADTVIIFDSDWNPQNDLQAQARCHRIGQTQQVKVYRLVTRNTYEAEMFDRASKKLGLDRAVLNRMDEGEECEGNIKTNSKKNAQQIDKWLRQGAYALFADDGDEQSRKFCEADIDQILTRCATTLTTTTDGKNSEFATASFTSGDAANDIDIDDPDFWKKSGIQNSIAALDEPRKRTQTAQKIMSEPFSDEDSGGEDAKPEGGSAKAAQVKKHKFSWSRTDRRNVMTEFSKFGWGRWEKIQQAKLQQHPLRDIEIFIRGYIFRTFTSLDPKDRDAFMDETLRQKLITPYETPEPDEPLPPLFPPSQIPLDFPPGHWVFEVNKKISMDPMNDLQQFIDRMRKEGKRNMIHFLMNDRLREIVEAASGAGPDDLAIDEVPMMQGYDWWTVRHDKHFLLGTYKHGIGSNDLIREDPELLFHNTCNAPVPIVSRKKVVNAGGEFKEDVAMADEDLAALEEEVGDSALLKQEDGVKVEVDNVKVEEGGVKVEVDGVKLEEMTDVKSELEQPTSIPSDTSITAAPAVAEPLPDTTETVETDATASTTDVKPRSEGIQDMDVSMVEDAVVPRAIAKVETSKEEDSSKPRFPSVQALSLRIRRLLLDSRVEAKGRGTGNDKQAASSGKGVKDVVWNSKERWAVIRTISTWGLIFDDNGAIMWNELCDKAQLPKKNGALFATYYQDLLRQCRTLLAGDTTRANRPADDDDDGLGDGDGDADNTIEGSKKRSAPEADGYPGDLANALPSTLDYTITAPPAKKGRGGGAGRARGGGRKKKIDAGDGEPVDPAAPKPKRGGRKKVALGPDGNPIVDDSAPGAKKKGNAKTAKSEDSGSIGNVKSALKILQSVQITSQIHHVIRDPSFDAVLLRAKKMQSVIGPWGVEHDKALLLGINSFGVQFDVIRDNSELFCKVKEDGGTEGRTIMPKLGQCLRRVESLLRLFTFDTEAKLPLAAPTSLAVKRGPRAKVGSGGGVDLRYNADVSKKTMNELQYDAYGKPVLPIKLGSLELVTLGDVVTDRPAFHTDRYIWPVGFHTRRQYYSTIDPTVRTMYSSMILDNGSQPLFRVVADDLPHEPFDGQAPSSCWVSVMKRVNVAREGQAGKRHHASVSGPEYFGITNPVICELISKLPGSELLISRSLTVPVSYAAEVDPDTAMIDE